VPIYTLGAAVLAFHVKRMDEAVRLLQKGILSNPNDARLKLMLASLVYQNAEQYEEVIRFLKLQIQRGDAPTMLVNILANTYEKVGRLQEAIELWQKILKNSDSNVQRIEAAQKLQGLYLKLKIPTTVEIPSAPLRRRSGP
jgi:tetratricopeptide (TPR) repeat protein